VPTSSIPEDNADRQPGAEHLFPIEVPELVDLERFRGVSQVEADKYARHASARALGRAFEAQPEDGEGSTARRK
jgi:hypothetical protein